MVVWDVICNLVVGYHFGGSDVSVIFVSGEDGGNRFHRNVGPCIPSTSHLRSLRCKYGCADITSQNVLPLQSFLGIRAIILRIFAYTRSLFFHSVSQFSFIHLLLSRKPIVHLFLDLRPVHGCRKFCLEVLPSMTHQPQV